MKNSFRAHASRVVFGVLGMAAIATFSPAHAVDEPWVAGPSVSSVGTKISWSGGNFVPGTVVLLRTAAQGSGVTTTSSVVVSPSGTIAHSFSPTNEGSYGLAVVDAEGKEIASTNIKIVR